MTHAKAFAQGAYGAFELKRCYQKNMFTGTIVSALIPIIVFLVFALIGYLNPAPVVEKPENPPIGGGYEDVPPPINWSSPKSETKIKVDPGQFKLGAIPNPVDATETFEPAAIPTRLQKVEGIIAEINKNISTGAGVYGAGEIENEIIPPPTTFVAHTEAPRLLDAPQPEYPEIARQAGIEGHVRMQIYVDKQGHVADARILVPSGANAGFEEAALAAAWGRIYRPAMQNDQPVGVWISYKVTFKLH